MSCTPRRSIFSSWRSLGPLTTRAGAVLPGCGVLRGIEVGRPELHHAGGAADAFQGNLVSSFCLLTLHTPGASRTLSVPCRIKACGTNNDWVDCHLSPSCSQQLIVEILVLGLCFCNKSVHTMVACVFQFDQV